MVALLCPELLLEEFTHIVMIEVDSGHHDMARRLPLELDDALSKVGFHHLDAVALKEGVHLALLSEHALALDNFLHVMLTEDAQYNLIELSGILRPMNDTSVFLRIGGKLLKILIKV